MSGGLECYEVSSVDRAEVLRYLGYSGQPMTQELEARIDGEVARCLSVCQPRGVWRTFEVAGREVREGGTPVVRLEGTALELVGSSIRKHLEGAVAVGVMAVTVGMGVERELRRLSLTDPVAQVVFDAAATTAVERAADACEASLVADARERGLYTNFRFSPGYGDFSIEHQRDFSRLLDTPRKIGLTVTESCLLAPIKSVTAVIGLSPEQQDCHRKGCEECSKTDCEFRRS